MTNTEHTNGPRTLYGQPYDPNRYDDLPREDLIALLRNEITLAKAFMDPRSNKILASMDYKTRVDSYQLLDADEVPAEDYPRPKDYLDPDPGDYDDYILRIDPAGTFPSSGAQQGRGAAQEVHAEPEGDCPEGEMDCPAGR